MSSDRGSKGDLFGRGMIYVVVWSMQMVVATVVSPILAHVLPVRAFGSLAAAIALYQLLLIVIVFGLDQALAVQRVEDLDDDQRARGLVASGMVASLVVTGLAAATCQWWGPALGFTSQHLLLLTLGWTFPGAAVLLVLSLLQAEDRLRRFSVVSLISTVGSQLVGIALLFIVGRTAETYAIGGVVGQCTALAVGLFWVRPKWRGLLDLASVRRALQLGMPLVLMSLSEYVLTAGDRFLIQRWLGAVEVARYQVAFTVGNVVTLLLTFTNRAWLPRLKSIVDPDERWRVIGASRDGMYVLAGWAAFGITIAAPALLRVFAPESYGLDTLLAVVAIVGLGALPVAASVASGQQLVTIRWSAPLAWGARCRGGREGGGDRGPSAPVGHQRCGVRHAPGTARAGRCAEVRGIAPPRCRTLPAAGAGVPRACRRGLPGIGLAATDLRVGHRPVRRRRDLSRTVQPGPAPASAWLTSRRREGATTRAAPGPTPGGADPTPSTRGWSGRRCAGRARGCGTHPVPAR